MSNKDEMSRVLYRHDWANAAEWATAFRSLADLTNDEVVDLATGKHQPSNDTSSSRVRTADEPQA